MELDRKILGLVLVVVGILMVIFGKYLLKGIRKDKKLIAFSLHSRHFLCNLLFWSLTAFAIIVPAILLAKNKQTIFVVVVVFAWLTIKRILNKRNQMSFIAKINLRAFDEREDLHCLKAERIAGTITAYSSLILLGIGKLAEPNFSIYRLLIVPFVIYHIAFNLASWWYFRMEENGINMENEKQLKQSQEESV